MTLSRRTVVLGAAAGVAGLIGASTPAASGALGRNDIRARPPLWQTAVRRGIVYGSSAATWQVSDAEFRLLYDREVAMLLTEDDLLWYRLRPSITSGLDYRYADRIIGFAERNRQLVLGAHLVWDQGFGSGWSHHQLCGLSEHTARHLLLGTVRQVVKRYRGRVAAWSVANEVTDPEGVKGLRTNVPWYNTIGPGYVAESFRVARDEDPRALLMLNEFGFETSGPNGAKPEDRRRATLTVLDALLDASVPVHALGVQAHLIADCFGERFHPTAYRRFLSEVADRGLSIVVTELDVLDDGLPTDPDLRDRMVADVYERYLDAALQEPAVLAVMTFGLSDRYTWLDEDYPRNDGAHRRPLPFDRRLRPKPAHEALTDALQAAPRRSLGWHLPRAQPRK